MTVNPTFRSSAHSSRLESEPEFRVALEDAGVAEILSAIERMGLTGTLSVSRGMTVKELTVEAGELLNAASTDLRDSLGAHLQDAGILDYDTVEQYADAGDGGLKLGERLVASNVLTPSQVRRAIRSQIVSIVLSLFSWTKGEASFRPDSVGGRSGVGDVSLRPLIYEGVLAIADPGRILSILGGPETVLRPVHRPEDSIRLKLEVDDWEFLRSVDGGLSIEELAASGPNMYADNLRRLYAFVLLGLLEVVEKKASSGGSAFRVKISRPSSATT